MSPIRPSRTSRIAGLLAIVAVLVGVVLVAVVVSRPAADRPQQITTGAPSGGNRPVTGSSDDAPRRGNPNAPDPSAPTPATAGGQPIGISVVLRMPGRAGIDPFLAALQDPGSSDFHRYLSPEEFGRRFGLDDASIARVRAWLESGGFHDVSIDPQRSLIRATGTVAQANALFGVTLHDGRTVSGVAYHVPDREPTIPAQLRDAVLGVTGLDDRPRVVPMFTQPLIADVPLGGMKPPEVRRAYDMESMNSAGLDGSGQTIAVISFDTFNESDIQAWEQETGTQGPPIERVLVSGPVTPGAGLDEVSLDIETIRSVAPKAKIINVEMPLRGGNFSDTMSTVLQDGRADIVSMSWGLCEAYYPGVLKQATDVQLQAAAAAGVTVYVASGDHGAYGCDGNRSQGDLTISVDYPSANPNVLSIGGTTLWVRQDGTWYRETAWAGPLEPAGTGGGRSADYARPAWQQVPGIAATETQRMVPDLAGPGDPETGLYITFTPAGSNQRIARTGGGTSQSAPFWAGYTSLIRQSAEAQGVLLTVGTKPRLGALNATFYGLATGTAQPVYHDVTAGTNLLDVATPGWDAATGLGTPIGSTLAQAVIDRLRAGTP